MFRHSAFFPVILILAILVSGCTAGNGSTPQTAFDEYRQAVADRDVEALKRSVADSTLSQMQRYLGPLEDSADMIFDLLGEYAPSRDDVVVESEKITGDSAEWVVSDKSDPSMSGTVTFFRKDGRWKVVRESWESQ